MTTKRTAYIRSVGRFLPERRLTNKDFEKMVDISDEWIVTRTGIRERRVLQPGLGNSYMAVPAAMECLDRAGVDPAEIKVQPSELVGQFKLRINFKKAVSLNSLQYRILRHILLKKLLLSPEHRLGRGTINLSMSITSVSFMGCPSGSHASAPLHRLQPMISNWSAPT